MNIYILYCAFALDCLFGDPHFTFHPVRCIGKIAEIAEKFWLARLGRTRSSGLLALISVIIMATFPLVILLYFLHQLHPYSAEFFSVLIVYFSFALKDLASHAKAVKKSLESHNIIQARKKLGMMVSRETGSLTEQQIVQSALESLAENYCDSVFAPLFFIFLLGPIGGWIYRIINTLDAMWGYRNQAYENFGFAAAKLDDIANYLPARLSAIFLILVSLFYPGLSGRKALRTVLKDARKHKSPNSGFPEAAVAGAIGISFGGEFIYFGKSVKNPVIGLGKSKTVHINYLIRFLYITTIVFLVLSGIVHFALWGN